jgi:hypothetical protein
MNMSTSDSDSGDHLSIAEYMHCRKNAKTMVTLKDDRARIGEVNASTRNLRNSKIPAVVLGLSPAESSDAPMQIAEKYQQMENLQKQPAMGRCWVVSCK